MLQSNAMLLRMIGFLNLFLFGLSTLFTFLVVGPAQLLALPWDPDRRVAAALGRLTWGLGMFAIEPFWRVTITGKERLQGGPWILVANHQSMLDIPFLLHLPLALRLVGRPGVRRMPVFGQMLRFGRHVVLGEDDTVEGLARCQDLLSKGITIAIFPEGTRGDGKELLPFSRGAFELALRTNRPLLPVVIRGTADALPKGSPFCREKVSYFHMAVLEPVPVPGQATPAARRRLATEVRQAIEIAYTRPRPHLLVQGIFERYRSSGRMAAGFAKGKLSWDPVFWALFERLPEEGTLLDVGCGEGLLGLYLRVGGKKLKILGVDHDEGRIARARRAADGLSDLDFQVTDARSVEGSFDVITVIDVLHYLPTEAQAALLTRLVSLLRPGGRLYLRDPEPGRGLAGWWTRTTERLFVALGRHKGQGVTVQGSVATIEQLQRLGLEQLRAEDCSGGGFANMLVSGQKSALPG